MTLEQRKKLAAHIQRILKVRRVSFPVANTEKGPLSLNYIKDAPDFEIVLDAVPLNMNDYDNRELKSLLEKYLFEKEKETIWEQIEKTSPLLNPQLREEDNTPILPESMQNVLVEKAVEQFKKKRGRPAKSK